jgi:hypothetical protein
MISFPVYFSFEDARRPIEVIERISRRNSEQHFADTYDDPSLFHAATDFDMSLPDYAAALVQRMQHALGCPSNATPHTLSQALSSSTHESLSSSLSRSAIHACVLIARYCQATTLWPTQLTRHRLFAAAMAVAIKTSNDLENFATAASFQWPNYATVAGLRPEEVGPLIHLLATAVGGVSAEQVDAFTTASGFFSLRDVDQAAPALIVDHDAQAYMLSTPEDFFVTLTGHPYPGFLMFLTREARSPRPRTPRARSLCDSESPHPSGHSASDSAPVSHLSTEDPKHAANGPPPAGPSRK